MNKWAKISVIVGAIGGWRRGEWKENNKARLKDKVVDVNRYCWLPIGLKVGDDLQYEQLLWISTLWPLNIDIITNLQSVYHTDTVAQLSLKLCPSNQFPN